jgi:hypothetical protein
LCNLKTHSLVLLLKCWFFFVRLVEVCNLDSCADATCQNDGSCGGSTKTALIAGTSLVIIQDGWLVTIIIASPISSQMGDATLNTQIDKIIFLII